MKPYRYHLFALALAVTAQTQAATVTLKAGGDASPTSSFDNNGANSWSDNTDPSAANDYVVAVQLLRTPQDAANYTFQGNSLSINTGGGIIYKGTAATQTYTIANLILNGGLIRSGAGSTNVMRLAGGITVSGTGSTITADQSPYFLDSVVTGTGALTTGGQYNTTFTGTNTYTGNLTVASTGASGLKLGTYLSSTSHWKFAVGASGTNNTISGTGKIVLGGALDLDLSAAGTTVGNSWTLVNNATLAETYESTFSVTGFISDGGTAGSRIWTGANGSIYYRFSEATGMLTVIEPDTDADGLADSWEMTNFGSLDQLGTDDPDSDGATNEEEETAGTNPKDANSWPDVDADGLKDAWERTNFGNITNQNATGDADGDLATNLAEFLAGTDPTLAWNWPDSDFDDMNDAWEIKYFGNLAKTGLLDSDSDNFTDLAEHNAHSNPMSAAITPLLGTLTHRWSFNGDLTDSVGGSNATIMEVGANDVFLSSSAVLITGGARAASDYVRLGTQLLPKDTTPVTIEFWATQNTVRNWGRVFDFNTDTNEYFELSWTRAMDPATDRFTIYDKNPKGIQDVVLVDDKSGPYTLGTEYHIVVTIEPQFGINGETKFSVYSAPSAATKLGAAKGSFLTTNNLVNLKDTVNDLARSAFTGDDTASATYNEVRMWNGVFAPYVLETLHHQGPNEATLPADIDADSLPDAWEIQYAANLTTLNSTGDSDSDGYSDREEYIAGSNPSLAASTPVDVDGDGLLDTWEIQYFGNLDKTGSDDPDGDLATNLQEQMAGTNPTNPDDDGDGLNDGWERTYFAGNTATYTGLDDPDSDGFNNEAEETAGSNPVLAASTPLDVDADGLADAWEILYFTNITAQDGTGNPDADAFTNEQEETGRSNPNDPLSFPGDVNGDGLADGHLLIRPDALGTSSFATGLNWADGLAPAADQSYMVNANGLRTVDNADPQSFAGAKLVFTTGGQFIVKGTGIVTVPNLVLDGGIVANASNASVVITLAGTINVTNASSFALNNNSIILNAIVSGTKDLTVTGVAGRVVTFNAANSWTGNLNLATAGATLASTGTLKFAPKPAGVTNVIGGTGPANLNGTFNIDLTGATGGGSWDLVTTTGAVTIGATFNVSGFTAGAGAVGARVWTSGGYSYDEATGILSATAGDSDSDGLTDSWEMTYFGNLAQTATGDFDGDGTSNGAEFRLGLIPNDGTSRFAAKLSGTSLTWQGVAGLPFTVQMSTTLQGAWTNLGDVTGVDGTNTYTVPTPAGKAFYRVFLK